MLSLAKPSGGRARELDGGKLRETFKQSIDACRVVGLVKIQVSSGNFWW
jgi:hypothetical protein